ncbi:hypothetical protein G6O52_26505, partial [Salmonella enterica subsp. enterica serovar Heidelberg]|nr:hypothetical protein [Salmonella enterica subsp. enterica serovar Heidelberg]
PVIVTLDAPLSPWNADSKAVIDAALRRDYALALSQPREDERLLVYVRRDLPARR